MYESGVFACALAVVPTLLLAAGGVAEAEWVPPSSTQPAPYHNALLAKLRRDEPVFGGFVTIPHYQTVENLASPGFLLWQEASCRPPAGAERTIGAKSSATACAMLRLMALTRACGRSRWPAQGGGLPCSFVRPSECALITHARPSYWVWFTGSGKALLGLAYQVYYALPRFATRCTVPLRSTNVPR